MKKMLFTTLAVIILIPGLLAGEEMVKILPLEIPVDRAAGVNILLVNLARLQALAEELTTDVPAADIILLKAQGSPLITLGSLKKGRMKWDHKTFGGQIPGREVCR